MFWPDVIDLKLFYTSPLGHKAEGVIAGGIRRIWPAMEGDNVLGIGFTQPYLEPYRHGSARILALMPDVQGALHWPVDGGKNLSFLADEADIPLPDDSMNRVLLMHAMENSEQLRHMLREVWRVLAPGGRLLAVVPNRRGVWARRPHNPFSHGSPFTAAQLRDVLREHRFTPYESHYTLFTPPSNNEWTLKASPVFEFLGVRFFTLFSGVILMEAEKQIYAPATQRKKQKQRERDYVPSAQPAMSCERP